ncbi:glycosyltransferase [Flavobacterium sp.]|uniref:glycosyltransferase n=1 Tax=Flavobacterium sp. TaxID=239 RepID=UPI003919283C
MKTKKQIALIIPSFTAGGAERVMATLANRFQEFPDLQVHLIILTGGERYYELHQDIKVYQPSFDYKQLSRFAFTVKILLFLRRTLKQIQPYASLSFGGKYNAFVLLGSMGLGIKTFISERSRPGISYGRFLNSINPSVYRLAAGIIAQTEKAQQYLYQKTKHKTIKVIGNPVKEFSFPNTAKKKVILNVGRFIPSKHQDWLIDYFNAIDTDDWSLWFLGDGPLLDSVIQKAQESPKKEQICFFGNQKQVEKYYAEASIFAFTSTSEGFPNVLGEALRGGCACISFDCEAGPSDLISDGENGILVPNGQHEDYISKLKKLIADSEWRASLANAGVESVKSFNEEKITHDFMAFINENSN